VALALEKRQASSREICYPGPTLGKGGKMRDIAWRMGFTLMALLALMTLAPNLSFSTAPYRLEEALGQTPQALVARYLTAVARGDVGAALDLWPEAAKPEGPVEAAAVSVTEELARYGAGMQYQVLDVSWWQTCCEGAAIDDPDTAGVATIRVAITGRDPGTQIYIFEAQAAGGPWGESPGSPFRDWTLTGVRPESQLSAVQAWR
jgi:hypothetical protein